MFPKGVLWRTVTICLLIFDYFLFVTGNPSLIYSALGGWFWVTLLAAAMIASSYAPPSFSGKEARPFYGLLSVSAIFSVALYTASSSARNYAATNMETQILTFLKDPENTNAEISREEQQLVINLTHEKYHKERSVFIPTFREMDYFAKTEAGENYHLTLSIGWDGTPVISLSRMDSQEGK